MAGIKPPHIPDTTMNPFAQKGFVEVTPGQLSRVIIVDGNPHSAAAKARLSITPSSDESKLNKTERAYLQVLRARGFHFVGIQNITLKLGDDCRYTPDFNHLDNDGRLVFSEVKGFMRDDALVKLKVAARVFSIFQFFLVRKNGSGWDVTEIKP